MQNERLSSRVGGFGAYFAADMFNIIDIPTLLLCVISFAGTLYAPPTDEYMSDEYMTPGPLGLAEDLFGGVSGSSSGDTSNLSESGHVLRALRGRGGGAGSSVLAPANPLNGTLGDAPSSVLFVDSIFSLTLRTSPGSKLGPLANLLCR